MNEQCNGCVTAAYVLRRMGMRDTIDWAYQVQPDHTTSIEHAFHANAGIHIEREETDTEYLRRVNEFKSKLPKGQKLVEFKRQPLCVAYRSELGWIRVAKPARTTVYMAHPLSNNFKENVVQASMWLRFLRRCSPARLSELTGVQYHQRPLIQAPWLAATEPDELHPGGREMALRDCQDTVVLFDELWMVGGLTSDGMKRESFVARVTRDLTFLGPLPPEGVDV